MSENLPPITTASPRVEAISEALHQTPGYEFTTLKPGESREFAIEDPMVPDVAVNYAADLEQDLYGIIEAGNEYFAVVGVVSSSPSAERLALTHIRHDNRRADVVGEITPEPLAVGRRYQHLGNAVSRRQFTIAVNEGMLQLHDTESANGTSFVRLVQPHTEAELAISSLSEYREQKHIRRTMSLPNPILHNFKTWSAESVIMRSFLDDPTVKLPIWREVPSDDDLIARTKADIQAPLPRPAKPHTEEIIVLDEHRHSSPRTHRR